MAEPAPSSLAGSPLVAPRRRGRALALVAAGIAVIATAGVVAVQLRSSDSGRRKGSPIPPSETTTTVTRQTLVDRVSVDGTLGYGGSLDLYDRLSGTFTQLPHVGEVIGRGGVLCRLNEQPVVLMYGGVSAYRTMKAGVADGVDVAQLNTNLKALGFDPYGEIAAGDDHFSAATAAAVRRFQADFGLKETGAVELGRVVFAPSARRVTSVHVAAGSSAGGGAGNGNGNGNGSGSGGSGNGRGSPSSNSDASAPAVLAVTTTSTRAQVQLQLGADKQQIARTGERVPVTLPDGRIVHGHVSGVGTVATAASNGGNGGNGGSSSATVAVSVTLDRRVAGLDQAPVSVALTRSRARNVLVVPATALVGTAGGGYAVEAVENGRRVELPVTPGLFAGGYVEVQGPGIHEGLTVTQSQ